MGNKSSRYGVSDFCRDETIYESEIKPRINELLQLNDWDWKKNNNIDEFQKRMARQNQLIKELEEHAYDARSMEGRVIRFHMADSYALYLVVKVNKTTCRLQWLNWGDGWMDDRLGKQGSLPINFVHNNICQQDQVKKIFT